MYCSVADIKGKVPEVHLRDLTSVSRDMPMDETKITDAITAADAMIDGILGGAYTVPLVSPPSIIKQLSVDIAVFKLYEYKATISVPEVRQNAYDRALSLLKSYANGSISMPQSSTTGSAASVSMGVVVTDPEASA